MGTTEKVPCGPRTAPLSAFLDDSYDADDECLYCDELIFELCNGHERFYGDSFSEERSNDATIR